MLRISVVIPTYNRASQIPAAVRCVLEQSLPPYEVIVVDDGSTDTTADALAPFMERIRYIRTTNGGASAARNRGVLEAQGDWIAFLDSDDTWSPSKLQRQLECIERTGAKVCFCVSTDESGAMLDELGKMDPAMRKSGDYFYPPSDCRLFNYPAHPFVQSMVAEKRVLIKAGLFDESLRVAEDTKLIYGLALDCGYAVVNENMVEICRDRTTPGLSDTLDPESAFIRYGCYARVQSEFHLRLVPIDAHAADVVWRNMLYFVSRQAEIACALGHEVSAKQFALMGLSVKCGWKNLVRNLMVLLAYRVARTKFAKKWRI